MAKKRTEADERRLLKAADALMNELRKIRIGTAWIDAKRSEIKSMIRRRFQVIRTEQRREDRR
jgi:hypothetical protein